MKMKGTITAYYTQFFNRIRLRVGNVVSYIRGPKMLESHHIYNSLYLFVSDIMQLSPLAAEKETLISTFDAFKHFLGALL